MSALQPEPAPEAATAMPSLSWRAKENGCRTWSSPQWTAFTGQSLDASRGLGWLQVIHPDDREATLAAWQAARTDGVLQVDHRIAAAAGGHRWFRSRAERADGGWTGTATDVDDLLRTLAHQREALAALQHRVRNTLGIVRSIARRSVHGGEAVEEYAASLDGRIGAIARVQAGIIREPLIGTDLAALVADELATCLAHEGERVSLDGPPIRLRGRAAESLGLAVHELAVNALRHGALASPCGHIAIAWSTSGTGEDARLVIQWRESGLAGPLRPPEERGFGSEVIEASLPYDLRATTSMLFEPDGLRVTVELPLASNVIASADG